MKRLTIFLTTIVLGAACLCPGCQAVTAEAAGYTAPVELVPDKYDGALPLKCSMDTDNSVLFWDVDILMPDGVVYENQVNAQGTSIQRTEREDDRPDMDGAQITVDYETAADTALHTQEGAVFEGFDLERSASGPIVYDVKMQNAQNREIAVNVDAQNGEVLNNSGALTPVWASVPFTDPDDGTEGGDVFEELFND